MFPQWFNLDNLMSRITIMTQPDMHSTLQITSLAQLFIRLTRGQLQPGKILA